MADEPQNNTLLEEDHGQFFVVELQPDGTTTRTQATTAEAIAYIDRLIAAYGVDGVPQGVLKPGEGAVEQRTLTRDEVLSKLVDLFTRLTKENNDPTTSIAELRGAIRSPKTIQAIANTPGVNPELLRVIWPDLDQILAWVPEPGKGGVIGGTGTAETGAGTGLTGTGTGAGVDKGTSIAEAGGSTGQGAGPLPLLTPPPLVEVGAVNQTGTPGGTGSAQDAARVGDPVLAFSGQLLLEAVDLEIEGIGLDVKLGRTYMHATGYDGPLGQHWDHTYNLWLRERLEQLSDGRWEFAVYRSTGKLSAERFVAEDLYDDSFDPAGVDDVILHAGDGNHDRLLKVGGRYRLLTPDGLSIDYNDQLRAERLRDRNGNEIRLTWEGDPPLLTRLVDTCGRVLTFANDDAGRLVGVRDESLDREIRYVYDDDGRLERVVRTILPGKPPQVVQAYRYWGDGAPPGMEANVLGILDGRGREVLQIEYGEQPGELDYNRVTAQRDGGVTRYDYSFVSEPDLDAADDPLATAVLRVEMTLADGVVHVLDYNVRGRLVALTLDTVDAGRLVSRWRYSEDGLVVAERRPDGSVTEFVHGRELFVAAGGDPASATPLERARFGELRQIVERRRPGLAGPPLRITEFDYDASHALVTERRGPYYADAAGNRIDAGPSFAIRIEYDSDGNPVALHHPDCLQADGTTQTGLDVVLEPDARGRLLRRSIALEDGTTLATAYEFPAAGDPTEAYPLREIRDADELALVRHFTHDAGGRVLRVEEPSGLVADHDVDDAGRLLAVRETGPDVAPTSVTTEWAPHDLPKRTTRTRASADGHDEPGAVLTEEFDFDAEGDIRASTVTSADGTVERTVRIERGPERRVRRMIQDGVVVEQFYDSRGLVVRRETRAPGIPTQVSRCRYDAAGRPIRIINAAGDAEELDYDGFGRLAERRLANGSRARYEWDAGDRLVHHTVEGRHPDAAGRILLHEERRDYDACGRLIREKVAVFDPPNRAAGVQWATREYLYDRADRVVEIRGSGPLVQRFRYDGLGRVVRAEDNGGTLAVTRFHDAARTADHEVTVSGVGPDGPVSFLYDSRTKLDARGQIVSRRDGLGNETTTEYDSDGNAVATVDAAGIRNERSFTPDGLPDRVRLAAGRPGEWTWTHGYDAQRRLATVDGPRGRAVGLVRDAVGRIHELHLAGRLAATYRYDDASRVAEVVEPSGISVGLAYAPGGRVSRRTVSVAARHSPTARDALTGTTIDYDYDGAGRLVLADDGAVPVARRYDSRGLLLSERTGTRGVAWEYTVAGAAEAFTFSNGHRLDFERGTDGLLRRVLDGTHEVARLWPLGLGVVRDVEWRKSVRRTERRDAAGRLLSVEASLPAHGTRAARLRQLADARGLPALRRLELPGLDELTLLDVDDLSRIVGESTGSTAAAGPAVDTLETAQAQTDLDAAITTARASLTATETVTLDVDPDGARRRRRAQPAGGPTSTTTYTITSGGLAVPQGTTRVDDADGLPRQAVGRTLAYDGWRALTAAGAAVGVERDALGRPYRLKTPAGDVVLVRDGERPVEAYRTGAPTVRLVRAPGSPLVLEVREGAKRFHPLADPDGTTLALLDNTGTVVARSGFDVFGQRRGATGTWPPQAEAFHRMTPLGGDLFLSPTRTYDAASGDFLEPDQAPLADATNLYVYGRGNPAAFTDPLGLMAKPGGATGRGAPDGVWYGHGQQHVDSFFTRFLATVGGSLWSIWNMITEPVKQLYDLGGILATVIGDATGWYHYEHRWASGIGQMADQGKGTLDIFKAMGQGIIDTPRRLWDAMERGDYGAIGAEALNGYLLGRAALSVGRSVGGFAFNRAVGALDTLGQTGRSWRISIRTWQVARMARTANRLLGLQPGEVNFRYVWTRGPVLGRFYQATSTANIYESAFTPSLRQMFIAPSELGGSAASQSLLSRIRFSFDNALRGNTALRTTVHEGWHGLQYATWPELIDSLPTAAANAVDPLEWTQPARGYPAIPFAGAWNMESIVPFGSPAAAFARWSLFTLGLETEDERK